MSSAPPPATAFRLQDFVVEPARNVIRTPGGEVVIEPKVMAVLVMLAGSPGTVVTRREFIDTIWIREYAGDESLTRAVSLLRKALGDTRGSREFIETIPRSGYRLVVTPEPISPAPGMTSARAEHATGTPVRGRWAAVGLPAIAMVAVVISVVMGSRSLMGNGQGPSATSDVSPPVVAVLPIRSPGDGTEGLPRHVSDGVAEELLAGLTRSRDISVIAASTSFRYRDFDGDFPRMARELAVTHVVDGTLRRIPDGLRAHIQLVDARAGVVSWSSVIEVPTSALFDIPRQVSSALLNHFGATPTLAADAARHEPDPLAYDAYLQATALLGESSVENLMRAIAYLDEAVARDPQLADAWGLRAMTMLDLLLMRPRATTHTESQDPPARLLAIRESARRALELQPDQLLARLALATADYRERRVTTAETELRYRAILADAPSHATVNLRMGMLLIEVGRLEASLVYLERAARLDRLSLLPTGMYLEALDAVGRSAGLRETWEEVLALHAATPFCTFRLALDDGDLDAARAWTERAAAYNDPRLTELLGQIVEALDEDRDPERLRALGGAVRRGMEENWINVYDGGQLLARLATVDEVHDFAADRIAAGDDFILGLLYRRAFAPLRDDPRIMELFRRDGVLDYWLETGRWPDFCAEEDLPYTCIDAAQQTLAAALPNFADPEIAAETKPVEAR